MSSHDSPFKKSCVFSQYNLFSVPPGTDPPFIPASTASAHFDFHTAAAATLQSGIMYVAGLCHYPEENIGRLHDQWDLIKYEFYAHE